MLSGIYVWAAIFVGPLIIVLVDGAIELYQKRIA